MEPNEQLYESALPQEPIDTAPAEEEPLLTAAPAEAPAPVQPPVTQAPVRTGKPSPFANAPYERMAPAPKPVRKPREKKPHSVLKAVTAAVLVLAVAAGSCFATAAFMDRKWESRMQDVQQDYALRAASQDQKIAALEQQVLKNANTVTGVSVSGTPNVSEYGMTPSQVYAANVASVVAIYNEATVSYYGQTGTSASSGSGFVLTADGYIVSNCHVVEGADKLTVQTVDGGEYVAKLVGVDESNDLSVLKIEAENLQPVTLGSSDALIVGDQVVAIGNPLGELTSTLTVGYVSAKDRTISSDGTYINMMQTDAAINPGNSGGPLFNMKGEVVGITTAKYSGSTGSGASIEGIGFAIPMDDVAEMISDLIEYGYVRDPAYLGVTVRTVDSATAATYGLVVGSQVDEVVETGCAYKAGVRSKDIITDLGGYHITGNADLITSLRRFKAGQTTTITVYRNGQSLTFSITLDEKPRQTVTEVPQQQPEAEMPSGSYDDWFRFFFGGRD